MQINSDWQKPRRFALRLLPSGYLRRYTSRYKKEIKMKRIPIILIAVLFLYVPKSFAGLYSSGYSHEEGTVIAAVQIKEKGLYNLVATIQFLHRPQNKKIYSSNEYEKLIDRLLVESRGLSLQLILENNDLSLSDLSGLKKI